MVHEEEGTVECESITLVNNHQGECESVSCTNYPNNREIITLNVSGLKFQTRRGTLRRYPYTLLGSSELEEFYEPSLDEYFFDRDRSTFPTILGYYQNNGILCLPSYVNPDIFGEEAKFFKLPPEIVSRFHVETMNEIQRQAVNGQQKWDYPYQKEIWRLFDDPESGIWARTIAYFDVFVIFCAVTTQCIESLPEIRNYDSSMTDADTRLIDASFSLGTIASIAKTVMIVEYFSNIWFTNNLVFRLVSCPDKREFVKSVLNWFDILAILPFYVELIITSQRDALGFFTVLRFFRTLRVVRIFKMTRYFQGLFALGYALSSSAGELVILSLMLVIFVVLFSSLIFFTDKCDPPDCPENGFDSVVSGFWWSIITMSTVGYGDYVPKTRSGKVVGSMCALTGILVISLPFPLIITRFNRFMKLKLANRKLTIEDGQGPTVDSIAPEYAGVAVDFNRKTM